MKSYKKVIIYFILGFFIAPLLIIVAIFFIRPLNDILFPFDLVMSLGGTPSEGGMTIMLFYALVGGFIGYVIARVRRDKIATGTKNPH
ncbi:MAG: hypothetical protein V1845_01320 [bacterium]